MAYNLRNLMLFRDIMMGIFIFFVLIYVVGLALVFNKAKVGAWKAFIPIYNMYILAIKIGRVKEKYFWIPCISQVLFYIIYFGLYYMRLKYFVSYGFLSFLLGLVRATLIFAIPIAKLIRAMAVGRNFGQSPGFSVGLYFLPIIFFYIIGLDDAKFSPVTTNNDEKEYEYEYIEVEDDSE